MKIRTLLTFNIARHGRIFCMLYIAAWYGTPSTSLAYDVFDKTALIELKQGSELSDKISFYRTGGYETSAGVQVNFSPWYSTNWTDSRITFVTQIGDEFGILWGFSTGEAGQKYRIDPSLKLGIVFHHWLNKNASISLRTTSIIGGSLHETSCVADYGEVGGIQEVNCRLAASTLQPSQTLQYLFNDRPYNQNTVILEYKAVFN